MRRTNLVLSRSEGEVVWIGRTLVKLFDFQRDRCRMLITSDDVQTIVRGELFEDGENVDPDGFGPYYVQRWCMLTGGAFQWITDMTRPYKELHEAGQAAEDGAAKEYLRHRVVDMYGNQAGPIVSPEL